MIEGARHEVSIHTAYSSTRAATSHVEYDGFFLRYSKPIIDEIDRVLAQHYGFTEEELHFIVNCHIKYRMGPETDKAAEEDQP